VPKAALISLTALALLQGCAGAGTAVERNAAGTTADAAQIPQATPTTQPTAVMAQEPEPTPTMQLSQPVRSAGTQPTDPGSTAPPAGGVRPQPTASTGPKPTDAPAKGAANAAPAPPRQDGSATRRAGFGAAGEFVR
jgi:hypothetical protein